ncbi:aminotransferase class V-fold PLP-dependent enzyme [Microlunatus antarcticus]|uniref:Isopenicillin-N epimerase n=1 Tax=Microlunatus antarcticus TaxID=53388 RepID=A0A7W5P823_9ACTN|nr:aminotransferase class V-fold PLP-dependent enzyme [Microlunatus antarcticus]MBB3328012.1 isopenicillin-N epimerase [Microlunatus antarcticus]
MSVTLDLKTPVPLALADGSPAASAWVLDPSLRHLNHGSFGAVPRVALDRQREAQAEMERAPVAWFPGLPLRVAGARARIAPWLRVDPQRLALVPNASGGASVVFNSVTLSPGAEILVTDHGYGAVTMGAARLAQRAGGSLRTAEVPLAAEADEAAAAVLAAVTDRTELIVIDHITSPTARRMPVAAICAAARERGITTLVDGAHAPLLLEDPVAEADADFWVGNLHKFGTAPRGSAVLVARPGPADLAYPLIDSWGGDLDFPERFDHQGTLDLTSWLAAPVALDFVEEAFGWDRVRRYTTELADWAQELLTAAMTEAFGVDCRARVGMPVGPIRLVGLPDGLVAGQLGGNALRDRMLAEAGMETAFTSFDGRGYLRLSAHAYNTPADYLDLVERGIPLLQRWAGEASPEPPTVNPEERREQ